jgi:hypothetical protein
MSVTRLLAEESFNYYFPAFKIRPLPIRTIFLFKGVSEAFLPDCCLNIRGQINISRKVEISRLGAARRGRIHLSSETKSVNLASLDVERVAIQKIIILIAVKSRSEVQKC